MTVSMVLWRCKKGNLREKFEVFWRTRCPDRQYSCRMLVVVTVIGTDPTQSFLVWRTLMKSNLHSLILVVVAVAGLMAATAFVSGYVDKPSEAAPATAVSQCDGCPLQGTDSCCKAKPADSGCAGTQACASPCTKSTCGNEAAPCCCQGACAASGEQAQSAAGGCVGAPCGAGGCAGTK
jgi:hypothetical protein